MSSTDSVEIKEGFIQAKNIEKSFSKRKILRKVSVSIKTGEIVGLLGPNGSGKTTLFYIIAGLLFPDNGEILLDSENIREYPLHRRAKLGVGYLPQDASIFRGMTTEENIKAALQVVYKDKNVIQEKLDTLISNFKINHIRKSPSVALSGGERRRLEIARAIAVNPRFILLDEPFAGVDPISVADLKVLIKELSNQGIGVLITDHNVLETLSIVDRSYILYDGEILFSGTKDEVLSNPDVKKIYLGDSF